MAVALHRLGIVARDVGDFENAERYFLQSLEHSPVTSNPIAVSDTYHHLGQLAALQGQTERAQKMLVSSLELSQSLGDKHGQAQTQQELAILLQAGSDDDRRQALVHWGVSFRPVLFG